MTTTQQLAEDAPKFVPPAIVPIRSVADYAQYAEVLKGIKAYTARVEAFFAPHKKRAREAWQGLIDEEKKALQPAVEAEAGIKRELTVYHSAQEELRQAEKRRLQDEARKREEARRMDEAAAMEREAARTGDVDLQAQAEQLMNEPVETPSVRVESFTPKVGGLSFKETWTAKVTDLKKLVKWLAKGKNIQYVNLVQPNQVALNAMARAQRENLTIDGVVAEKNKGAASGR